MKNNPETDALFATLSDQPSRITVPARMIWLRGLAQERQRAAQRSLLITRMLSLAGLLVIALAGGMLAMRVPVEMKIDAAVGAVCAMCILGFTALQLFRAPR